MLRSAFLVAVLLPLCVADDHPRLRPVPAVDQNLKTGPAIGTRIPEFQVIDQNGRRQTFKSLRSRHGLALLFVRSADW